MIIPSYQLKGILFRSQNDQTDLIQIDVLFQYNKPIESRKMAFSKFQSYIEVLLESKGLIYQSHTKTEKALRDFTDSYNRAFQLSNPELGEVDVDAHKGLYIYLIIDPTKKYTTREGETEYQEKLLIHYIDNQFTDLKMDIFISLQKEMELYRKNDFDIGPYHREIDVSKLFEEEEVVSILDTPISFQEIFDELL
jgi:hypothetical protein